MTRSSRARRLEIAFEAWGRGILRFRWLTIALTLGLSLGLASQLPRLTMDNTTQGFLHADDPILLLYNDFRDQFGRDELILISIRPPEVFDLDFLRDLRSLHADLEREVPHLDEVNSLINARHTRGSEDELIVEDLLEDWPETPEALDAVKMRAMANPLYTNLLLSEDGRVTAVAVRPDVYSSGEEVDELSGFGEGASSAVERTYLSDAENNAILAGIREVMSRYGQDWQVHIAGGPVITERLNAGMQGDIGLFLVLTTLLIMVILFILFRRVSGVILPVLVVVLSLLSTLGVMSLLGKPLSVITEILPPFLIAVGVCDSIHILAIVYRRLSQGDSRDEAIVFALGHSGLAVVMTSVTTAGGLLSFSTAGIAHIANLGILAPIGIMLALLYSLTLLPALLGVVRLDRRRGHPEHPQLERLLIGFGDLATRHPVAVVLTSFGVLAVAGLGAAQVRFSHDPMKWFPKHEPLRIATEAIDKDLQGTMILEVLVKSDEENGLHDPELLKKIDTMMDHARSIQEEKLFVGKVVSIVDILKETHQALNENRGDFYRVPDERRVVSQELLLFENSGSDDLEDVTDSLFSTARITIKVPQGDAMTYPGFLEKLTLVFDEILEGAARIEVTGLMPLLGKTFSEVVRSMARSYVAAIVIITPMMIMFLGSFKRGLLSMIPNVAPILIILGVMGWFKIPLDGSNLLVGSIILGLAVDDTIHFMHKFWRYFEETGDPQEAVRLTLQTTGSALLFTSIVLSASFLVFMFGYMVAMFYFGLLAGLAAIFAFLADVLFAPALLTLVVRRREERAASRS